MEVQEFLPPTVLILWTLAFRALAFENQRWNRAISAGTRGAMQIVPFFVALTGFLGLLLSVAVLVAVFVWGGGWKPSLGLLVITLFGNIIVTIITTVSFGGDNWLAWLLATLGMYPVGYFLAIEALALAG